MGEGSWGVGTAPALGVLTVHLSDKIIPAPAEQCEQRSDSEFRKALPEGCALGGGALLREAAKNQGLSRTLC